MSKIIIPMAAGSQASGTITENITENGTYNYDVETYKNAEINVDVAATTPSVNFIATSNSSKIAYSEDGINFYGWALPSTSTSICFGNKRYVALGSTESSYPNVSLDGICWVSGSISNNTYWSSVCYGNGKYVAVRGGYGSNMGSNDSNIAAYSTDGITWTQTTLPSTVHWKSVCYGNGKYVAIANSIYNSSTSPNVSTNVAAYSTDGITWTKTTLPVSTAWKSVCYGNGKFVAVANNSTAAYSTDGITWTQTTMPASANWLSVCYGNGKYVAVVHNSSISAYSTDGITWTQTTMPTSATWQSVCYGNGKYVAVAYNSTIAAYSTDGITWTQTTLPTNTYWWSVCSNYVPAE